MSDTTPFDMVKKSLRVTTTAFDDQITFLMTAAMYDLGIAEVNGESVALTDPLVLLAVTTYCRMHFGQPDDYDRLKQSYDEQKAQMSMATGYTIWGELDG